MYFDSQIYGLQLKEPVKNNDLEKRLFAASADNFGKLALELFHFQYRHNTIYRAYCDQLQTDTNAVTDIRQIPFLPISFFKTHVVTSTEFEPEVIFESSGTTGSLNSRHYVKDCSIYHRSYRQCYRHFYGRPADKCILALLPSYLERGNSSLVMMAAGLIEESEHPLSGFYLYDHEKLHRTLLHNELRNIPTLLIGVTYALLDFAEKYPMRLRHTIVMETGGMKGRREEMTRAEVHGFLQERLGLGLVHSEYGMTELLSQAYSKGDGIFHPAPWLNILLRAEDDPFEILSAAEIKNKPLQGAINCIDLANMYSCAFIATDDLGRLHANGSFEVMGRLDNSDVRGCSLMAI